MRRRLPLSEEGRVLHIWHRGEYRGAHVFPYESGQQVPETPFRIGAAQDTLAVGENLIVDAYVFSERQYVRITERPIHLNQGEVLLIGAGPHGEWAVMFEYQLETTIPNPKLVKSLPSRT